MLHAQNRGGRRDAFSSSRDARDESGNRPRHRFYDLLRWSRRKAAKRAKPQRAIMPFARLAALRETNGVNRRFIASREGRFLHIHKLHHWNPSPDEAVTLQRQLAS